ncbi:MAG: DUF167 domain-containing protein [Dehalococcoidia bacterium]
MRVRLTPRAARDEIAGWKDNVLRVRVTAPPVEGRANDALERVVSKALGLPRSAVRVASGERGRDKTLAVDGLTSEEAQARLSGAPAS